jgi:predicted MFS family arabinose efflux permease
MFVQWASFHWVFWFVGIIAIPVALACLFIIPPEIAKSEDKPNTRIAKWKRLDLIGVSILTGMTFLRHIQVIVMLIGRV